MALIKAVDDVGEYRHQDTTEEEEEYSSPRGSLHDSKQPTDEERRIRRKIDLRQVAPSHYLEEQVPLILYSVSAQSLDSYAL